MTADQSTAGRDGVSVAPNHATNIGRIVLALAHHVPGDGECGINDPIVTIVDSHLPAHELLQALADMNGATAAGIVSQLIGPFAEQIGVDDCEDLQRVALGRIEQKAGIRFSRRITPKDRGRIFDAWDALIAARAAWGAVAKELDSGEIPF